MDKKDTNERSTANKLMFGTLLSNGLVIGAFGLIILFVGLSGNWHLDIPNVGILGSEALIIIGAVVLLAGVGCIGAHFAIKKD